MTSTRHENVPDCAKKVVHQSYSAPNHLAWATHKRKLISYTFVFMVLAAIVIWFCSFRLTEWISMGDNSLVQKSRMATVLIMVMFGGMGALYLPDGLIKRPSEKVWKFVTGLSMFYLMILVYMVFLTRAQTQTVLRQFFDSSLGTTLPEKSYASDCRIYTPELPNKFQNLTDNFFDVFMVAHLVGWYFKVLICRDIPLVLFQSVLFQVLELCLKHLLPNFYECWWDHLLLDILGCNLLGIYIGWEVIKKYKLQRLKWSLRQGPLKKSFLANMMQFWLNTDVSKVEYKFLTSTKKFLQVMWFVLFMPLVDLTLFFNKFVLNIPPSHYINTFRTLLVGMLSINASKEYYHYITRRENQMRINAFMLQSIVLVQILLFFKNYDGQFTGIGAPFHAKLFLFLSLGAFGLTLFKIVVSDFYNFIRLETTKEVKTA